MASTSDVSYVFEFVADIHLLSWNLGIRDAPLDLVVAHVTRRSLRGESFVVALQECSEDADALHALLTDAGAQTVYAIGNGPLSVLSSEPLEALANPVDAVGLRFVLTGAIFAGRRIAIVNYHGKPEGLDGAPACEERGGIASEARWRIDEHASVDPVVVVGDFNALPDDVEIASKFCFSFAEEPAPSSAYSHNRARRCIRARRPSLKSSGGTFHHSHSSLGKRWLTFDFVAHSAEVDLSDLEVLTQIDGESLTDDLGRPSTSDHLPVGGILRIHELTS